MPSEAANRWWGETEKMEAGQYKAVSLKKKKITLLVSKRRKSSPCVARGHTNRAGTPTVSPFLPAFPVKRHLLFLSSDNCPRGWAPQDKWWVTVYRFLLEISLV